MKRAAAPILPAAAAVLRLCVAALVVLFVGGCRARQAPPSVPRIEVETVRAGQLPESVTFGGYVRAQKRANVSATASGTVARLLVREGERVSEGQPLLVLDGTEALAKIVDQQASVDTADAHVTEMQSQLQLTQVQQEGGVRQARIMLRSSEVQLHEAQLQYKSLLSDLKRKQRLYRGKAIPHTQVESAELAWQLGNDKVIEATQKVAAAREALRLAQASVPKVDAQNAQLDGARASLAQARDMLTRLQRDASDMTLRAPIAGSVVTISVTPGQAISAGGGALFTIVDNRSLEMVASVDQRTVALIHRGASVSFSPLGNTAISFPARIANVMPTWDETTRTVKVHFNVPVDDKRLMDGLAVRARLRSRDYIGVLVPLAAMARGEQGDYVVVIENGVAKPHDVTVAIQNETYALVEKGLNAGDTLALQSVQDLTDGQRVEIVTKSDVAH